ncbi:MAG: hypothetical protein R3B09_09665 [Nannocystaceae bacterium]
MVTLAAGGCRLFQPTNTPSRVDELVAEAREEARVALEEADRADAAAKASERAARAAIDRATEYDERSRAAEAERTRYADALVEAREAARECIITRERLVVLHQTLLEYVSDPRRDAAIEGLEPCRKAVTRPKKADLERENAAMRQDVASTLEKEFDTLYPDQRGHLIARVKGDVLLVDMPKFSTWDAQSSQTHVEVWCTKAPNFTSIVLKNMHGTFKCQATEPPKEFFARMLRVDGLAEPWVPAPSGPKTPPPEPGEDEIAEIERIRREMAAAVAKFEEDATASKYASERAESAAEHYEAMVDEAYR